MSLIRINVTDRNTVLSGEIHGSDADPLVATLTAEPETIEEFEKACTRFIKSESDWPVSRWFARSDFEDPSEFMDHVNLEPYDAGIVVIDLAARMIACDSTYSTFSREGTINVEDRLSDGPEGTKFGLPYKLWDEWEFVYSIDEYEVIAPERREKRMIACYSDPRPILYGEPLLRYIAEELGKSQIPENEHLRAHLHARWLMTAMPELDGKTPRELLMEKKDYIDFDLHSRSLQYSFTKTCPPDLDKESKAYKSAGFGIHEIVVYYDLVRHLMESFHRRKIEDDKLNIKKGIEFLAGVRDKWLETENMDYSGRIPLEIIEAERQRRNLTMSPHECLIDEDCPICVEMSQIFDTPMFWHLDGSHMDDRFEFSFHDTQEEWLEERESFEAYMKEEMRREFRDERDDDLKSFYLDSLF